MSDDGFIDILPAAEAKVSHGISIAIAEFGRNKVRQITVTFRFEHLDTDTLTVLQGPRFNVAYNPAMRCLRIKRADGMGKFELRKAIKGSAQWLRIPFPEGAHFSVLKKPVSHDVNLSQGALLLDLPEELAPPAKRPAVAAGAAGEARGMLTGRPLVLDERAAAIRREIATPPAGDQTPALMGDPAPGRSALDQKGSRK